MRIYVAGPIAIGDQFKNVRNAIDAAEMLHQMGHKPFVPHLFKSWHMIYPKPGLEWLDLDFVWLDQCEAVYRVPGESWGSDQEVKRALDQGKPVYFRMEEVPNVHD
jgi:hypothetical protein